MTKKFQFFGQSIDAFAALQGFCMRLQSQQDTQRRYHPFFRSVQGDRETDELNPVHDTRSNLLPFVIEDKGNNVRDRSIIRQDNSIDQSHPVLFRVCDTFFTVDQVKSAFFVLLNYQRVKYPKFIKCPGAGVRLNTRDKNSLIQ